MNTDESVIAGNILKSYLCMRNAFVDNSNRQPRTMIRLQCLLNNGIEVSIKEDGRRHRIKTSNRKKMNVV